MEILNFILQISKLKLVKSLTLSFTSAIFNYFDSLGDVTMTPRFIKNY